MKKIVRFTFFFSILLVVAWTCTNKEINLITNIDYNVAVNYEASGFVRDVMPTQLVLTSELGDYPDLKYFVRYQVTQGAGYFVSADGTSIPAETDILLSIEQDFTINWSYIGTTVGTHDVNFFTRDNFEKQQTHPLRYTLQNLDIDWEAVSSQSQTKVGDTLPINLNLTNNHPERAVDFFYTTTVQQGLGSFLNIDKSPIVTGSTLSITAGTTLVYFIPAAVGDMRLVFRLTDSNGQELDTSLGLQVLQEAENIPPVALAQVAADQVTRGEAPFEVRFIGDTSTDPDGMIVSYLWQFMEAGATATEPNPTYVFEQPGTYQVQLTVTDNKAAQNTNTDTNRITIIVEAAMLPDFVAIDDEAMTERETPVQIAVLENDNIPDGSTATITTFTQPLNGTVTASSSIGSLIYTANTDFEGKDEFTYTISNEAMQTATAKVVVTVTKTNAIPVAVDDMAETDENTAVVIPVLENDTDADNSILTIASTTNPDNGMLNINANGTITYTPNLGYFGSDTFEYTITDGVDESSTAAIVTIMIRDINQPPVAMDDTTTTTDLEAIDISVLENDTDEENDPITITEATALNGEATINTINNTLTYTPKIGFTGTDQIMYTITDGIEGNMDEGVVTITISRADFVSIPDPNFEQFLINRFNAGDVDPTIDGRIARDDMERITRINFSCEVDIEDESFDLTGIETLINLEEFDNESCNINYTNFSIFPKLTLLVYFNNSSPPTIDLSENKNLEQLVIESDLIEEIDLSIFTKLKFVNIRTPKISKINLSGVDNLASVILNSNPSLTCVQVSDIETAKNNPNWSIDDENLYSLDCGF